MTDSIQDSQTIFRLSRSHWHCRIANFEWETVRPQALRDSYMQFLEAAAAGEAPHLLLTGAPGIGKTHLGVAAYRWMVLRVGTELATWINLPTFCDQVKAAYSYTEAHDPLSEYEQASRFVVLDDLFGRDLTTHEAGQIVYRLLDIAYQNGAALLITMNQSHEELKVRLPKHEVSRLLANVTIIPMQAEQDWRGKK